MAVTVTLTPNVSTYTLGDAPLTVAMSGGIQPYYLWESNSGTFSNKFASSSTFTPANATNVVSIIGRKVIRDIASGNSMGDPSGGIIPYGTNGGQIKVYGSSSTWYSGNSIVPLSNGQGFLEFTTAEANTEKAAGLLFNGGFADPYLIHPTNAFQLAWHMLANGTAIPKKLGVPLASTVVYKANDVFRVAVEGSKGVFYLNGVVVATTSAPTPTTGLYASMSFRTLGATINNPSFFMDATNNEGSTTISVMGLLPVQANYSYDLSSDNETLVSTAEDGSATFRVKGGLKKTINLQFIERPYSEYLQLINFWKNHQKHIKFIYQDLVFNDIYLMRFDTGFRTTVLAPDSITMQVTLKEV